MATPFMNLNLPTPTITIGPTWASNINTALETIDNHDHSSGKGVKVKPNGLDINANLDMQINELLNIEAAQLSTLNSNLTGPTNILKLHSVAGNLWFTNGNGTAVQLTSGGSIIATPGAAQSLLPQSVTSDTTILSTDAFVTLLVDTSAPREITLPFASSVAAGRLYIVKDIDGTAPTNPITILTQSGDEIDGATSVDMDIEYGAYFITTDGATKWYFI
jgi:hypothetical protein